MLTPKIAHNGALWWHKNKNSWRCYCWSLLLPCLSFIPYNIISLGSLHLPLVASYNFCHRIRPGSDQDGVGILPYWSAWGIGRFLATTMSLIATQEIWHRGLHFSSHHILYLCPLHMWILGKAPAFFPCRPSLTTLLLWFLLWKGVTAMDSCRDNL